jgi:transposase
MRIAPAIVLSEEDRAKLPSMARARSLSARTAERAWIVLLASEGKQDLKIAQGLRVTPRTAARWRGRFRQKRSAGLKKDAPRPGRTPIIAPAKVREVVEKTSRDRPADAPHWSTRSMLLRPESAKPEYVVSGMCMD